MKRLCLILILIIVAPWRATAQQYQDTSLPISQRVEDLLEHLTLDEKLSLMEHRNPAIPRLGLGAYSWWNEALHGVARNGRATVFPMPIALAATWDTALIRKTFNVVALEARIKHLASQTDSSYNNSNKSIEAILSDLCQMADSTTLHPAVQSTDNAGLSFFAPNINIFRDPRWGRGMETFGEDPWLTAQMGLAAVNGLQHLPSKAPFSERLATAACLKHFAVHSGPESTRHQFDAQVSARDLHTTYLPAFAYIIQHSDVKQVMSAYNRLNGTPCSTNKMLLEEMLRNRWHYNGIIVTDCWALNDCWEQDSKTPRHETHSTATLAAKDAFGKEVDLECGSGLQALRDAVDSGYLSEKQIDEHLRRILSTRMELGIDDIPQNCNTARDFRETTRLDPAATQSLSDYYNKADDSHRLEVNVAKQSMVLLKNNGILPMNLSGKRNYALVGPNSDDSAMVLGNYNGAPNHYLHTSIKEAFLQNCPHNITLFQEQGCGLVTNSTKVSKKFWKRLQQSDAVIFVGGLSPAVEGEELQVDLPGFYRGDRTKIELPETQVQMIQAIKQKTGKPIILVLCTGSAIGLEAVKDYVDAIVVTWYGGEAMGQALWENLTCHDGVHQVAANASFGNLPITFYRNTQQLPPFEDYSMQRRTYRYMAEEPLYLFGYGLRYSQHQLDTVWYDSATHTVNGSITVELHPKLSQERVCVQVYLQNPSDSLAPTKSLVGFKQVTADTQSSQQISFSIPLEADSFLQYDEASQQLIAPKKGSRFVLQVGFSSANRDLIDIPITW